jgi:hypothetical protein
VQSKQKRHEVNLKCHSLRFPQWDQNDKGSRYSSHVGDFYTFAIGIVPFYRCTCSRATVILCVCRLNAASSVNTQFRVKSKSGMGSHSFDILVSELEYSIVIPCSWQLWSLVSVTYTLLHSVSVQSRYGDRQFWNRFAYVVSDIWKYNCWFSILTSINSPKNKEWISVNLALSPVINPF